MDFYGGLIPNTTPYPGKSAEELTGAISRLWDCPPYEQQTLPRLRVAADQAMEDALIWWRSVRNYSFKSMDDEVKSGIPDIDNVTERLRAGGVRVLIRINAALSFRHAVWYSWMLLAADRRTPQEAERVTRSLYDRLMENLEADFQVFTGIPPE